MALPASIKRRSIVLGAWALACAGAVAAQPAAGVGPIDLFTAIDVAGRQRMLSQRIVKAYCQIGLKVTPEASRAQLDDALRLFDRQLAELEKAAPSDAVRQALGRTAALWAPLRRVAAGKVDRDGARWLAQRSEALLQAANEVVNLLQDAAAKPQARLVNIAGRQRLLSQRLAKLYMLRAWRVDSADIRERIDSAANEFSGALALLRAAPEATPQIQAELDAVALQWEWFASAIKLQGTQSFTLIVASASESILHSMDGITALFAEVARR